MKKDPASASARYGLAVVKGLEGKTLESVEQLHEAFRLSPDLIEKALTDPQLESCLLYTSPSPRDRTRSRMPSSA